MNPWYGFRARPPLTEDTRLQMKALAGFRVKKDGSMLWAGANAAWLGQRLAQMIGVELKLVSQPTPRQPYTAIPRIPEMREHVSGFEQSFPDYLLAWQKQAILQYGHLLGVHLWWAPGCLSGETELVVNRAGKAVRLPLAELVRKFNGGTSVRGGGAVSRAVQWDLTIPTMTQSRTPDGLIRLNRIVGAYASGVKETWRVTTKLGRSLRATKDHRFIVQGGEARLSELSPGDRIYVDGGQGTGRERKEKLKYEYTVGALHAHPYAIKYKRETKNRHGNPYVRRVAKVATHRLMAEARRNGLSFAEFRARIKRGDVVGLRFLDPKIWEVHHKDEDTKNNALDNLEVMRCGEHQRHHAVGGRWRDVQRHAVVDEIVAIDDPRMEMTYDLEMEAPHHNFLANGIVVHNSGKTLGAITWALLEPGLIVFVTRSAARRTIAADIKRFTVAPYFILEGIHPQTVPPGTRFVVTGWDTLVHHADYLASLMPATVVFDEIHRAKQSKRRVAVPKRGDDGQAVFNARSGEIEYEFHKRGNMASAAETLSRSAQRILGATASPIKDRLRDLWAQLDLVEPGQWGNFAEWVKRYCAASENQWGGLQTGGRAAQPYIQELLQRLSFSVCQVPYQVTHANLPPKRRQVTYIPTGDMLKDEGSEARRAIEEAVMRARQDGGHSLASAQLAAAACRKRPAIVDILVEEELGEKTKIVVLTGLRNEAEKLHGAIRKKLDAKVDTWFATGGHSVQQRDEIREAFMAHAGPCVLVGTMQAWGESLNLQDTDVALVGMLPYTPGEVAQMEGRFSRQGQRRPTRIRYLIGEGTYDEHIAQLLLDKLPSVEKVVGDAEMQGFGKSLGGIENEEKIVQEFLAKILASEVEDDMKD